MIQLLGQVIIFSVGVGSIFLIGRKDQWHRWGYVLGIADQFIWFYISYHTDQWGLFGLCAFYLYLWSQGFYNYWIKKIKTF